MADAPSAYPLAWPTGYPRTPAAQRKEPKFNIKSPEQYKRPDGSMYYYKSTKDITVAEARKRLQNELDRIDARMPVLSSNIELRLDGLPRSDRRAPDDPGIAVYFQLKGRPVCLPCDRYKTAAGNIAAIAAHIEATRAIERHGIASVEQMFTGFMAIRGPGPKPWREVLGIKNSAPITREQIQARRRELARQHHPDAQGSEAVMAEINAAADRALAELPAERSGA